MHSDWFIKLEPPEQRYSGEHERVTLAHAVYSHLKRIDSAMASGMQSSVTEREFRFWQDMREALTDYRTWTTNLQRWEAVR